MNWFLIALIPPVLWAATNYFDKYLISKYFKGGGVGALMIFSSLIGLFLLPVIFIFHPQVFNINLLTALLIMLNGFLYILSILPYFYALQKDEASIAVPLFQMIPVFSYLLAFLVLKETLLARQVAGGALIVIGAILITLEINKGKKIKFKKAVFLLMMLSSLLFSLNFLFFKFFTLQAAFWTTSFWEYTGFIVFAAILVMFVKPYRNEFISVMKQNKIPVIGLNGLNEILNIIAKIAFNFSSTLMPITIIWFVDGLQPMFIFLYGILLSVFFPKVIRENLEKRILIQKLSAIVLMMIGIYFIKS